MFSRLFGVLLLLFGVLLLAQAEKENKVHHRRKGLGHPAHLKPILHHKKYLDDLYDKDGAKKHLGPVIKKKWANKKMNPRHHEDSKLQHHLDFHKRDPWDENHRMEGMHLQSLDHPRALPLRKLTLPEHTKPHTFRPVAKETSHETRKEKGHHEAHKKAAKKEDKKPLPTGFHPSTVPKKYHEKDYYLKKHVKKNGKKVNKKHHFVW